MFDYAVAKKFLVEHLGKDALYHENKRYNMIGKGYDILDENLPRADAAISIKLQIAFEFWGGWIDARNHDWKYYKGIEKADWSVLARHVINALVNDEEITDPLILQHFKIE